MASLKINEAILGIGISVLILIPYLPVFIAETFDSSSRLALIAEFTSLFNLLSMEALKASIS